jgi:hypothetical protein
MAIKRIFRYLVHTPNLVLWYPKAPLLICLATPIRIMPVAK